MNDDSKRLKQRLKSIGIGDPAIRAAWPTWWSEAADASTSAQTELRFSLARKLGLDPHSLLDDGEQPRFIWRDEARFKNLRNETASEKAAIASFASALGKFLITATKSEYATGWDSLSLRTAILANQPYVRLVDLISACWSLGIPLIHLRVFPCARKRMAAMSVRVGDRCVIMIGKDSMYPAHTAFHLAHELGHIALGHLSQSPIIVDFDKLESPLTGNDSEEVAADRFALELLTGRSRPVVLPRHEAYGARELSRVALVSAPELAVEPGTLALCFGFSTNDWITANAAMRHIYENPKPVWAEINKAALREFDLSEVPEDARSYLGAVLGKSSR